MKHACGHDAHTAIVLGVAETLAAFRERFPGTLVTLFQPAEEGLPEGEEGGAALMIKEGALDDPRRSRLRPSRRPDARRGSVGWCVGPIFAAADTFRLEVRGKSTHGAYPHTGVDPIPVAAEMVLALQAFVARASMRSARKCSASARSRAAGASTSSPTTWHARHAAHPVGGGETRGKAGMARTASASRRPTAPRPTSTSAPTRTPRPSTTPPSLGLPAPSLERSRPRPRHRGPAADGRRGLRLLRRAGPGSVSQGRGPKRGARHHGR